MILEASELILNRDGSIYHLNLKPENIADTIITVGDQNRVEMVASFFDNVDFQIKKREFHTQTGTYKGKRLTVISTGIGTDNIDIVFNELDALANIDLETRTVKKDFKQLQFIRIGTSGGVQPDIPVNSFVVSESAIGFDGLLHYYQSDAIQEKDMLEVLENHLQLFPKKAAPYIVNGDEGLVNLLADPHKVRKGITATNVGFYAPQGRVLRAQLQDENFMERLVSFENHGRKITNLEMETSAIYGMAKLFGHKAVSMNAILANRATGEFSKTSEAIIKELIQYTLDKITGF